MRVAALVVMILLAGLPLSPCLADSFCEAPLSDWQPREALQAKLEGEGWRDVSIRIEDGCYLVHAFNNLGERLHGKFDPATLAPLPGGHDHQRHDGWSHDQPED
jgi:hypothetical protein